jgi:CheY-like chemotaxis protein
MKHPKRVLCVEDNADSFLLLKLLLRDSTNVTYEVQGVQTAAEALACLKQQDYDLVILDWFCEEEMGVDLCQKLRQFNQTTPVLFYSVEARQSSREKALAAGAQEFLLKPDDLPRLIETIDRLALGEHSGAASAES